MKYENLFKIHIPEPCHEDWNKMTPNRQGAFCKVCAKTVVDFSGKTDDEIQRYLSENMDKKLCGRFKVTQLEEVPKLKIEKPKFEFPGFLIPVLTPFRACALSLMIFASAALMSCGNSGGAGGDDEKLAGAIALVDSTYEIPDTRIQGGISIKQANDSTCKINDNEDMLVGKIAPIDNTIDNTPATDTVKTDTTETMIKGEIEPRIKMGMLKKIEPKEEAKAEKEYLQGDVKAERKEE